MGRGDTVEKDSKPFDVGPDRGRVDGVISRGACQCSKDCGMGVYYELSTLSTEPRRGVCVPRVVIDEPHTSKARRESRDVEWMARLANTPDSRNRNRNRNRNRIAR